MVSSHLISDGGFRLGVIAVGDAQLAIGIGAPGPHGAVGPEGQSVGLAGGHHGYGLLPSGVDPHLEGTLRHRLAILVDLDPDGGRSKAALSGASNDVVAVDGVIVHRHHVGIHDGNDHIALIQPNSISGQDIGTHILHPGTQPQTELLVLVQPDAPGAEIGGGNIAVPGSLMDQGAVMRHACTVESGGHVCRQVLLGSAQVLLGGGKVAAQLRVSSIVRSAGGKVRLGVGQVGKGIGIHAVGGDKLGPGGIHLRLLVVHCGLGGGYSGLGSHGGPHVIGIAQTFHPGVVHPGVTLVPVARHNGSPGGSHVVIKAGGLGHRTQLTIVIVAPTHHIAVLEQGQSVVVARGDDLRMGQHLGILRLLISGGVVLHRIVGIVKVGIGALTGGNQGGIGCADVTAVAQLASAVVAPGHHMPGNGLSGVGDAAGHHGQGIVGAGLQPLHHAVLGPLGDVVIEGVAQVDPVALHDPDGPGGGAAGSAVAQLTVLIGTPGIDLLGGIVQGTDGRHMLHAHRYVGYQGNVVACDVGAGFAPVYLHRQGGVGGGVDAQLALVVGAEHPQQAVPAYYGGGVAARRDLQAVRHQALAQSAPDLLRHSVDGIVGQLLGVYDTQLAVFIVTPGIHIPVGVQGQCVLFTSSHGHDVGQVGIIMEREAAVSSLAGPVPQIPGNMAVIADIAGSALPALQYRGGIKLSGVDLLIGIGVSHAVTQLAPVVLAPGIDYAVLGQSHAVVGTGGDSLEVDLLAHVLVPGLPDHDVLGVGGSGGAHHILYGSDKAGGTVGIPLAHLTVLVGAPGPDGTFGVQEDAEALTGFYGGDNDVAACLEVDDLRAHIGAGHQHMLIGGTAVGGGIVAQNGARRGSKAEAGTVIVIVVGLDGDGGDILLGGAGGILHQEDGLPVLIGIEADRADLAVGGRQIPAVGPGGNVLVQQRFGHGLLLHHGIEGKTVGVRQVGVLLEDHQLLVGAHDDGGRDAFIPVLGGDVAVVGLGLTVGGPNISLFSGGGVVSLHHLGVIQNQHQVLPGAGLGGIVDPLVVQTAQLADDGDVALVGSRGIVAPGPSVAETAILVPVVVVKVQADVMEGSSGSVIKTGQIGVIGVVPLVVALAYPDRPVVIGAGPRQVVAHLALLIPPPDIGKIYVCGASPAAGAVVGISVGIAFHRTQDGVTGAGGDLDDPLTLSGQGILPADTVLLLRIEDAVGGSVILPAQDHLVHVGVQGQNGCAAASQGRRLLTKLSIGIIACTKYLLYVGVVAPQHQGKGGGIGLYHNGFLGHRIDIAGVVVGAAGSHRHSAIEEFAVIPVQLLTAAHPQGVGGFMELSGHGDIPLHILKESGGISDTQLAVIPAAPGYHRTVRAQGGGVAVGGGNGHYMGQIVRRSNVGLGPGGGSIHHPDRHGTDKGTHIQVTPAIAQLKVSVVAPGVNVTVPIQRQGEIIPGGNGNDIPEVGIHLHRSGAGTVAVHNRAGRSCGSRGIDRAADRAEGVLSASTDLNGDKLPVLRAVPDPGSAAAQLAVAVGAPSIDPAVFGQGQAVVAARSHGDDIRQVLRLQMTLAILGQAALPARGPVLGSKAARIAAQSLKDLHRVGFGCLVADVVVTQLSAVISAPGPHGPIGPQHHGVGIARSHHSRRYLFIGAAAIGGRVRLSLGILDGDGHQEGIRDLSADHVIEANHCAAKAVGLGGCKGINASRVLHLHQAGIQDLHLEGASGQHHGLVLGLGHVKAGKLHPVKLAGIDDHLAVIGGNGLSLGEGYKVSILYSSRQTVCGPIPVGSVDEHVLFPGTGAEGIDAVGLSAVPKGIEAVVACVVDKALLAHQGGMTVTRCGHKGDMLVVGIPGPLPIVIHLVAVGCQHGGGLVNKINVAVHQFAAGIPAPGVKDISLLLRGQCEVPLKSQAVGAAGRDGGHLAQVGIEDHVGTAQAADVLGQGGITAVGQHAVGSGADIGGLEARLDARHDLHREAAGSIGLGPGGHSGIAQLSVGVAAPGVDPAGPGQGQGVGPTAGHRDDLLQEGFGAVHFIKDTVGSQAPGGVVTHAQLLAGILAPGVNAAVAAGHQAVVVTSGNADDVGHVAAAPVTPDPDRIVHHGTGVVAQLAFVVLTPGIHPAIPGEGHGPFFTGHDLVDLHQLLRVPVETGDQGGGGAVLIQGIAATVPGAVAQLTVGVPAPGIHVAVLRHRQGVMPAGGHMDDHLVHGDADLNGVALGKFGVGIDQIGGVLIVYTITQLAILIVAPGPDRAVALQSHVEVLARRHHGNRLQAIG